MRYSVKLTFRILLCLLILSHCFKVLVAALPLPASSISVVRQSTDENELRVLADAFFKTWAAKDIDGFLRLWSAKSPELEASRKLASELFANSGKIEVNNLLV